MERGYVNGHGRHRATAFRLLLTKETATSGQKGGGKSSVKLKISRTAYATPCRGNWMGTGWGSGSRRQRLAERGGGASAV
eukprot:9280-Chlamydomonas_euryale.AAC.2